MWGPVSYLYLFLIRCSYVLWVRVNCSISTLNRWWENCVLFVFACMRHVFVRADRSVHSFASGAINSENCSSNARALPFLINPYRSICLKIKLEYKTTKSNLRCTLRNRPTYSCYENTACSEKPSHVEGSHLGHQVQRVEMRAKPLKGSRDPWQVKRVMANQEILQLERFMTSQEIEWVNMLMAIQEIHGESRDLRRVEKLMSSQEV